MRVRLPFGDRPGLQARVVDSAVTVMLLGLFVLQVISTVGNAPQPGQRDLDLLTGLLGVLMALPFLVHRRRPLTAAAVTLTALLAVALMHGRLYPGINAFVLLFGICRHSPERWRRITVFVATEAVLTVAVRTQPEGVVTTSTWVSTLLFATVAGLVGDNLRQSRARWAALEERARFIESEREERARRAVVDERLRIARELHDVVAHSMSVIAVQAGVGHHVLDSQPEEARRALAAIGTTSRAALTEMRRLLGVLREEGQPQAALAPAPGLADLPRLLSQVREAGLDVTSTVSGDPSAGSVPVDLTAYRIVQEALTNALKHGGPVATVRIDYGPSEVRVEVVDGGRPAPARSIAARNGLGHGLIGMRERVAVFGGRLQVGAVPGGGFRVLACLPVTTVERS
jgi:signal transduction histidine kinase